MSDDAVQRWDDNAAFWDAQMGADGNSFFLTLTRPAVERLLGDVAGQRILEIACGNGLFARRLTALGADVVATDGAAGMIEHARAYPGADIDYRLVDAADPAQLAGLGQHAFDAVVCNMALMDMAEIDPLAAALPALLRQPGRFVFSITHPCFNTTGMRMTHELEYIKGERFERYGVVITQYATPTIEEGIAIDGQPHKQLYFDRPLHALLAPFFAAGLVLNGMEEPAFPPREQPGELRWEALPEIPPVMCCRLVPAARSHEA